MTSDNLAQATFGGGCFWCTEAVFQRVIGVEQVVSGYAGGETTDPTYEQVCSGRTGHAEVIQVTYDPQQVSYEELLEVFFKTHDPTTLNRQGADTGTQYRSVIFAHDDQQRQAAEQIKQQFDESGVFHDPIVTQIERLEKFYPAEQYHQNYFRSNPHQPYCAVVIPPKLQKLESHFPERVQPSN